MTDRCPTIEAPPVARLRRRPRRRLSAAARWAPAPSRRRLERSGGRRGRQMVQGRQGLRLRRVGRRPGRRLSARQCAACAGSRFGAAGRETRVQVGAGAKGAQVTRVLEVDAAGAVERPQRSFGDAPRRRAGSRRTRRPPSPSPARSSGSTTPRASASWRARTAARTSSSISRSSGRPAFRISPKASRSTCASSTRPRVARRSR